MSSPSKTDRGRRRLEQPQDQRAPVVVLPQPRLADEPERLAARDAKRRRRRPRARGPTSAPQERRRAEREVLDEVADLDEGLAVAPRTASLTRSRAACKRAADPPPPGRARWQATRVARRGLERAAARRVGQPVERVRAARMERAAARRADQARRRPGIGSQRARGAASTRDRREQAPGVRVLGRSRIGRRRPLLDDPARVHDGDLVGRLGDDAQVVGDEDDRRAELRAAARAISSRICAWTVTSSAVVGSSAISSSGSMTSAIAIITRWRMPPESSCG